MEKRANSGKNTQSANMKLPKDRNNNYSQRVMEQRASFLSDLSKYPISHLTSGSVDPELTRGNIESIIGFAQVPVGVVGPLRINGEHASGDFYIPLSTTEGALIASYNRGARAISLCGGVNVVVTDDGIQRAPYFVLENVFKAKEFMRWIEKNFSALQQICASTTNHGKLESYQCFLHGRTVYLRLHFSTGDAMGMNMVTKASYEICHYIVANFPVELYAIESNMAVDKKPAHINAIMGRGKTVTAEIFMKKAIISRFLHTTAKDIDDAYRRQVAGGQMAGIVGSNGHIANGLAAIFLACGQDLGNVADSCMGYIYTEAMSDDLYVSLKLPSLIIGTVGGGVSLPTQRECLEIIGCYGTGKAKKLAEVVVATLMAGEISLAASVVAGDFVSAHEKYGRNKPGG
ncbi:MAG: hydroxymethylglutaryl-CoA reductase [Bacteroidota bacterium]